MRRILVLAVFVLAGLVACEDDFTDPQSRPPLSVTETTVVPAEEAQLDEGDPVNISVPFNRAPDAMDNVQFRLFPPPASSGEVTASPTGRILTWNNVVSVAGTRVQRLLIDGPTMEEPFLRSWFVGSPAPNGLFRGSVLVEETTGIDPSNTLVFALCVFCPEAFNPLDPGSFAAQEPLSVTRVTPPAAKDDVEATYVMPRLPDRTDYLVVAVLDTNHDGAYDPRNDWWGFYGDQLSNDPRVVTARAGFDSVATMVDIELGPPRSTQPDVDD